MKKIDCTDTLFVTLSQYGKILLNVSISGIESMAQLMGCLKKMISGCAGIVTMNLRNRTQGWCKTEALLLTPAA